jgi:hypothetical protein
MGFRMRPPRWLMILGVVGLNACAFRTTAGEVRLPTPTMPPPLIVTDSPSRPQPTSSPAPSPTPTPSVWANELPPDVNPLTGLRVPDPAVLNRRPLAIKISNYPPVVRPQSGVDLADLVFEHYAEGRGDAFHRRFPEPGRRAGGLRAQRPAHRSGNPGDVPGHPRLLRGQRRRQRPYPELGFLRAGP